MSTTLPTDIILPEDGGDSQIWDNKLNESLTIIDRLLRQIVALDNEQNPIGTVKTIRKDAPLPTAWEEVSDSEGRVLVSESANLSQGQRGGAWNWEDSTTAVAATGSAVKAVTETPRFAAYGRWILRSRDLTLDDLKAVTPV